MYNWALAKCIKHQTMYNWALAKCIKRQTMYNWALAYVRLSIVTRLCMIGPRARDIALLGYISVDVVCT